ncbi:hypothetical protein M758_8G111400 [Ceratodon purpureus]|uniref:HMA domain-containing protein n=1 Tax=Ceratodon purpureus TaxID=3225 RepID=A0A8T0H2A7_CERPU|nr:hypothetical protein KC19_8G115200 [Ceratodon purpureus]KAG0608520.1 hypothetical protein M758_8G111400 [Ceratodon purpureus]
MEFQYPIYAKDSKDVPDWMKGTHEWQSATPVDKLPKLQLKVKMCCLKCEEKVIEEIREVPGVFDVRAERLASKVVVVAMPPPIHLDDHEVLRRAKKIHRKAKFVELDAKEKPKKDDGKKKQDDEEKKKKEADDKKKKEHGETIYTYKPMVYWGGAPIYAPQPTPYFPGEYRPSQNYAPRYHYPPLPNQPQDGYFRQYVYNYV